MSRYDRSVELANPVEIGQTPLGPSPRNHEGANVLTIGDKFPTYELNACVDLDADKAFAAINQKSYEGKWRIVFFWPKNGE